MKIGVYYVESTNVASETIKKGNFELIEKLAQLSGVKMELTSIEDVDKYDLVFDFIAGGGTEGRFLPVIDKLPHPIFLVTTGENNSLAASMEILSYLQQHDIEGEIIHGSLESMAERIKNLAIVFSAIKKVHSLKIGRVGKPSDWLISSNVDAKVSKKENNIEIVDIPMEEFFDEIKKKTYDSNEFTENLMSHKFDEKEKELSLCIYGALKRICAKYALNGVTVRCFDLLGPIKSTGCVALAILNAEGVCAACEGDVPALISMCIAKELTGQAGFMANPSRINSEKNEIIFAHCTLPINMGESYECMTHYESGLGVAFRAKLTEGPITVFKSSGLLDSYFVSDGQLIENLSEKNLCRTQVRLQLDEDVNYFLTESIGNHHIILLGNHAELIDEFYRWL